MKKAIIAFLALTSAVYLLTHVFTEKQLRAKLSKSVVYVTNEAGTSGGTGFAVRNDQGKEFIVTNAHVCKHTQSEDGVVSVRLGDNQPPVRKHIIEISNTTDLCIIEPMLELPPLQMASGYNYGDRVYVLGHPYLQPLTFVSGEIVTEGPVSIVDFIITPENKDNICYGEIKPIQFFIFEINACVITYQSIYTTNIIYGGNSGSPLTNDQGDIVGVIFAANSVDHWGKAIKLTELREFINKH